AARVVVPPLAEYARNPGLPHAQPDGRDLVGSSCTGRQPAAARGPLHRSRVVGRVLAGARTARRARSDRLMDINHLMFSAAVMMGATAVAVGVAKKLGVGSIVALLAVGMVLGPHSPMPLLTGHVDEMQAIGEIGVALLIFAVGLDLQPTQVWSIRRLVFGLGTAQYVLTTLALVAFLALS